MFLCVKHNVVYVHVLNHKNSCVETKQNEMNRQIRKLFQILFEIVYLLFEMLRHIFNNLKEIKR